MTRERIAGFLFGISVGAAIGFFLKPQDEVRRTWAVEGPHSSPHLHAVDSRTTAFESHASGSGV